MKSRIIIKVKEKASSIKIDLRIIKNLKKKNQKQLKK